jgi:hypothetical protein
VNQRKRKKKMFERSEAEQQNWKREPHEPTVWRMTVSNARTRMEQQMCWMAMNWWMNLKKMLRKIRCEHWLKHDAMRQYSEEGVMKERKKNRRTAKYSKSKRVDLKMRTRERQRTTIEKETKMRWKEMKW